MERERGEQTSPDLFSATAAGDASPPPSPPAPDGTAKPAPQRHVLPKNLRKAVKYLSDAELDLPHAATLQEMKRREADPYRVFRQIRRNRLTVHLASRIKSCLRLVGFSNDAGWKSLKPR
jgi:hypothetical protein